jgi:hypothetical protein
MNKITALVLLVWLIQPVIAISQINSGNFWEISNKGGIIWHVAEENKLPHADNIEMAGQKTASIIYYTIDKDKRLSLERDIIFAQLRSIYNY